MVGFWIFAIVLVMCVTIVICTIVYNADGLDVWKIQRQIDEMDRNIRMIGKVLEEAMKEGGQDDL